MDHSTILSPIMQMGFAGFSAVLLVVVVWAMKALITIQKETTEVIAQNTLMIQEMRKETKEQTEIIRTLREDFMRRPCMVETGK